MTILLALAIFASTEDVWTVQRPLDEIVGSVMTTDHPQMTLPPGLFDLADRMDMTVRIFAKPGQHYYRSEIAFAGRRLSGVKTLEVWGKGGATICRSRVTLTFGRNGCLVRWLLGRVERRVIAFERVALRELTYASQ